jgi:competence protein ComEC
VSGEDRLFLTGCFFVLGITLKDACSIPGMITGCMLGALCFLATTGQLNRDAKALKAHVKWAICFCLAMLSGFFLMNRCACLRERTGELLLPMSGESCEIRGAIGGMPEVEDDGKWSAVLIPDAAMGEVSLKGVRIRLTGPLDFGDEPPVRIGHIVKVSGRFYLPGAPLNPGEPDMQRIMASRRLDGTLYVKTVKDIHILGRRRLNLVECLAESFRNSAVETASATLSPRHARILTGMLLGQAPPSLKPLLEATGTSHLFAASGLHVGYVALAVMAFARLFGLPNAYRMVIAYISVWIYAAACGLRPSVVRAAFMFSVGAFSMILGRRVSSKCALTVACIVMFIHNPYLVFSTSTQLSFLAVFSIIHLYPRIRRLLSPLGRRMSETFGMSVSAHMGVAPVVAWYFNTFTPVGVIANVPCIILAGFAVLIGLAATFANLICPPIALVLNTANTLVLHSLEAVIGLVAKIPFGTFSVRRPSLWFMFAYYLCIIIVGAPRRLKRALYSRRTVIVLLILAALASTCLYHAVRPPEVEVVFLSVGQGDSIFLQSPKGKTVLVDGGGLPGSSRDPGKDIILPYLRRRGIDYIDAVVITHPHYDHIGGLFSVIDSCRVGMLIKPKLPEHMEPDVGRALTGLAHGKGVPSVELSQGSSIDLGDGVRILVLNPCSDSRCQERGGYGQQGLNDMSLVMRLEFLGFTLLLTGDAGESQLATLIGMEEDLSASVLKVPHHGSKDALSGEVMGSINPQISVISVGPNTFSHPSSETVSVLEDAGSIVFRTDVDGAVIIRSNGRHVRAMSVAGQRKVVVSKGRGLR